MPNVGNNCMKKYLIILMFTYFSNLLTLCQNFDSFEQINENDTSRKIFIIVDEMPRLSEHGDMNEVRTLIQQNLVFPDYLGSHDCLVGKIYVQFIVEPNGMISNKKILNDINIYCNSDSSSIASKKILTKIILDTLDKLPPLIPGKQNGKEVPVQFTFPIIIELF